MYFLRVLKNIWKFKGVIYFIYTHIKFYGVVDFFKNLYDTCNVRVIYGWLSLSTAVFQSLHNAESQTEEDFYSNIKSFIFRKTSNLYRIKGMTVASLCDSSRVWEILLQCSTVLVEQLFKVWLGIFNTVHVKCILVRVQITLPQDAALIESVLLRAKTTCSGIWYYLESCSLIIVE